MILSIIIPTYNSERTIIRAIDSCCIDSINEVEIVVVDDGSKDKTIDIIKKEYKKYISSKKIRVVSAHHGGAGNARNLGIKKAIGKWIMFLDSDDMFIQLQNVVKDLKKYDEQKINIINYTSNRKMFNRNKYYIVKGNTLSRDNLGLNNDRLKVWNSGPIYKAFNSKFLKKNNITFPVDIKIGEDLIFNQKCLQTDTNILIKYGTIYRVIDNESSVTHMIINQDILDDGIRLTRAIESLNLSLEYKQMFIAKNFISLMVRFLKSDSSVNNVVHSLVKYKNKFYLKKPFIIYGKISCAVGINISLVSYLVWNNPKSLRILFPIMKKIKYGK